MTYSLNEVNGAIAFLGKHGAKRANGVWLSKGWEVLHAEPIEAARRLRSLLIEKSHRDASGEKRTLHR